MEGKSKEYIIAYNKSKEDLMSMHQPYKRLSGVMYYPDAYFAKSWVNLTEDLLQGAKDALYDVVSEDMFGGTEPTFVDEKAYDWWTNLSVNYFEKLYALQRDGHIVSSGEGVPADYEGNRMWREEIVLLDKPKGYRLKKEYSLPEHLFDINS